MKQKHQINTIFSYQFSGKKMSYSFFTVLLLLLLSTAALSAKNNPDKKVLNVLNFGAVGDSITLDSHAIQKTIDSAAVLGNGSQVFIPGGHRYLVGTLILKSNIEFHLDGDAELFVSTKQEDYINDAVIIANEANNLKITGTGKINGRDLEFMDHYEKENEWWIPKAWRPKIFILTKCKNLEIRDISFGYAPQWGLHMLGCENVVIDNIKIKNNLQVPNCDGIDPDHCRNVTIQNCNIVCGDDAVVIKATHQVADYGPSANILVKDCILETQDAGVKIGTETTKDIYNITFERCKIITSSRGIAIQLRDEGNVFNITFKNIEFVTRFYSDPWWGRGEGISFTAIPRTPETKIGTLHDVTLQNIKGTCENSIRIYGTKESRIKNINFENVSVTLNKSTSYKGGLFDNRPTKTYTEIEQHDTPGIYIQYADNVVLNNCTIKWGNNKPDYYTNALKTQNVTGLKLKKFTGEASNPDKFKAILNE
jgi:polygalacturonase